jgi:hypothetical protein
VHEHPVQVEPLGIPKAGTLLAFMAFLRWASEGFACCVAHGAVTMRSLVLVVKRLEASVVGAAVASRLAQAQEWNKFLGKDPVEVPRPMCVVLDKGG